MVQLRLRSPERWPDADSMRAFDGAVENVPVRLRGRLRVYFERFERGRGAGLYKFRRSLEDERRKVRAEKARVIEVDVQR